MLVARDLAIRPPGASVAPLLEGFSLEVRAGEWVAITGANGSGKSCLALALGGLIPVAHGTLSLNGLRVGPGTSEPIGGAIAVVLQEPASQLLQGNVADELAFTARNLDHPAPEIAARLEAWSQALGLSDKMEQDPRTLSAGWQQVVLIGAALISAPRLLVVDEGGAHLDATLRRRVLEALRTETEAGLAVLWVTQEPDELEVADRIVDLGGADRTGGSDVSGRPPSGGRLLELSVSRWRGEAGPSVRATRDLDLAIERRGVHALIGPNGCGKSVLLGAAAGLVECPQIRPVWKAQGLAPPILTGQYPEQQIFSEIVREELLFAATRRGVDLPNALKRATTAFEVLGLGAEFLSRRTWNLSVGEKRMVEIVAALIAPASLVILDEPTCGLDASRKFGLIKLVRERSEQGAILFASQDLGWVSEVSGRVVDMTSGEASKDAKYQQKNGLTQTCPSPRLSSSAG